MELEGWSNNAILPNEENKTNKHVFRSVYVAVAKSMRPIVSSGTDEDSVDFKFADGYGISHYRSLFDVLVFNGVLDTNPYGYSVRDNAKMEKQTQPIGGDIPANITAEPRFSH